MHSSYWAKHEILGGFPYCLYMYHDHQYFQFFFQFWKLNKQQFMLVSFNIIILKFQGAFYRGFDEFERLLCYIIELIWP